jgi:Big-like domain-containing protein/WD40 repeat protein
MNALTNVERTSSRRRSGKSLLAVIVSLGFMAGINVAVITVPVQSQTSSPSDSKIAFQRIPDEVDTRDIYVMNADGSGLTQLTTEGEETSPVWSPDGSKIAFVSYHPSPSGNSDVYVMNADGNNKTNLTNTPGMGDGVQETSPDWGVSAAAPPDTTKPTVGTVAPTNGATSISRATNVVATFSEAMDPTTLSKTNIKLYKVTSRGTTEITNLTVTPSADGTRATLNPYGNSTTVLEKNTTYQALVSTGARDLAGNALDQSKAAAGNQPMKSSFKTGG